ncbi:MAG TPA: hypothetical protein VGG91_00450 [Myxococcaceae bacterium]|jgi:hypothetical protein
MPRFPVLFLLATLLMVAVPGSALAQHLVVGIRVGAPPPAVRVERVPVAPSPRHVWVPGGWWWDGARYEWRAGAWMVPPGLGEVWVPASWHFENGQWTYYAGYWSPSAVVDPDRPYQPAPPMEPNVATTPPPLPLTEAQPPSPFDGAAWIPGYWWWGPSGYIWVGGRGSADAGRRGPRAGTGTATGGSSAMRDTGNAAPATGTRMRAADSTAHESVAPARRARRCCRAP